MPKPTKDALKKITNPVDITAIGYAYVDANNPADNTSISYGKKNAQSTKHETNDINNETRFPAASLSKIVFSYLVLRLVKENYIGLDDHLCDILPYDRVMVDGEYPDKDTQNKAEAITVRHVLSHTSGLPNVGSDPSERLTFNAKPGDKYEYSGEAILYLQKAIETKMSKKLNEKVDLQMLAKTYLFDDKPPGLGMTRSTFLPPSDIDSNIVHVHSELGQSMTIEESLYPFQHDKSPTVSAVGSLLTTADDFSKLINGWLDMMNDKDFKEEFSPPEGKTIPTFDDKDKTPPVCALGWHLFQDESGQIIAYQYGLNVKMRAFVAINLDEKKGAAFFTNCEHGLCIANQVFGSADLAPIAKTNKLFKTMPDNPQSDEPGWTETLAGKIAEHKATTPEELQNTRKSFIEAAALSPDETLKKQRLKRLEWFDLAHTTTAEKETFDEPALASFARVYTNQFGDRCEISLKEDKLVYQRAGQTVILTRITKTDFLPEKDQAFKVSIEGDKMTIEPLEALNDDQKYHLSGSSDNKAEIKGDEVAQNEMPSMVHESGDSPKHSTTKIMKTKLKVQAIDPAEKLKNIAYVASVLHSDKMKDSDGNLPPQIQFVQKKLDYLTTTDISNDTVTNVILTIQSELKGNSASLNEFAMQAIDIIVKNNTFQKMKNGMADNPILAAEASHTAGCNKNQSI